MAVIFTSEKWPLNFFNCGNKDLLLMVSFYGRGMAAGPKVFRRETVMITFDGEQERLLYEALMSFVEAADAAKVGLMDLTIARSQKAATLFATVLGVLKEGEDPLDSIARFWRSVASYV